MFLLIYSFVRPCIISKHDHFHQLAANKLLSHLCAQKTPAETVRTANINCSFMQLTGHVPGAFLSRSSSVHSPLSPRDIGPLFVLFCTVVVCILLSILVFGVFSGAAKHDFALWRNLYHGTVSEKKTNKTSENANGSSRG